MGNSSYLVYLPKSTFPFVSSTYLCWLVHLSHSQPQPIICSFPPCTVLLEVDCHQCISWVLLLFWSPTGFGQYEAQEVRLEGVSKEIGIFVRLVFLSTPTPIPRLLGILAIASLLYSHSSCEAIPSHLHISVGSNFPPFIFSDQVLIMASCIACPRCFIFLC